MTDLMSDPRTTVGTTDVSRENLERICVRKFHEWAHRINVGNVATGECMLRDGSTSDAGQLTALFMRSRARAMPWLAISHDEASTRWWMEHSLLVEQRVRVAHHGDRLLGFTARVDGWLEHLYVDPDHQGQGIGRMLLEDAQFFSRESLSLRVFTRNSHARRFYEAAGFTVAGGSDGSGNEEQEPDLIYIWTG